MEEKLLLFKKNQKKGDGTTFPKYFMTTEGNDFSISTELSNDAKAQIVSSGLNFPLEVTLGDEDYFLKQESYENANGVKLKKDVIVILSFTNIAKANLPKKTIADLKKDYQGEVEGA